MKLDNNLKFPFYRVFGSFAVGTLSYFCMIKQLTNNSPIETYLFMFKNISISERDFLSLWYLCVPVFCIAGEIFCMVGEMIINPIFDYHPFHKIEELSNNQNKDAKIEKISPCSEQYIYFSSFRNDTSLETSELHYALSRIFAGLMAVAMTNIFFLLPFIIALVFAFCRSIIKLIFHRDICNIFLTVNLLLLGLVAVNTFLLLFKNDCLKYSVTFLLALFFSISSIYYRAHANKLIYLNQTEGHKMIDPKDGDSKVKS